MFKVRVFFIVQSFSCFVFKVKKKKKNGAPDARGTANRRGGCSVIATPRREFLLTFSGLGFIFCFRNVLISNVQHQ